ncbi:S41 family peptidase [Cytophagaceae bacterium ABcell3]|nr:S41 family peptidase [Cytophagaceae bacterium ABcell3]
MSKIKNRKFYIRLPFMLALAIVCGIFIGATLFDNGKQSNIVSNYMRFAEILTYIQKDYVDTVDIDELVDHAIVKMLEKLDPHTAYIPKKDIDVARSQLEGDFEGIGIEFNIIKDTIFVIAPISGGPSESVGLMAGDKIVTVDGENVAGKGISNMDVFGMLRGKKGTKVEVSVVRKGSKNPLDFTIVRDKIPTYSVDATYMIDDKTGYIKISRFSASTYKEFKESMKELQSKGMEQLVLDLRDNPGGYMDRATKMVDDFLPPNKLIVYTQGKDARYNSRIESNTKGSFEEGAVVVLINEGSASASEIVSGALQDHDRALIVGRRSFGKGLVQMPIPLNDGAELRLTISRYYTPSGRSIQKPYSEDEDYASDLSKRFKHGEFFHKDSIRFDDSLKYTTAAGRTVYGGGGIMPDIFVPRDTSMYTNYLAELFNKNIIREYTLDYFNSNKKKLKAMEFEDYLRDFVVTDEMLQDLVKMGKKVDIKYKEKEFKRSKEFMRTNVKAYIARSVWGNRGFYPVINKYDEVFQTAIKNMDKARKIEAAN